MKISLLTGGGDRPYALGLLRSLINEGIVVDFVCSDDLKSIELERNPNAHFLNLRGSQDPGASTWRKAVRICAYYCRLVWYAARTDSRVVHILWANRFLLVDRVLLVTYLRILRKRIVFTAHNVNERERDGGDSRYNRWTLGYLYRSVDHIFVHTRKVGEQLQSEFGIDPSRISVIPFGINDALPRSGLTRVDARRKLGFSGEQKVILFFGNIAEYKGLEYAVSALKELCQSGCEANLVIAGPVKGCAPYWERVERLIVDLGLGQRVRRFAGYIPDEDVEAFFEASDVLVLPYRFIYQSGVLSLAYSFGIPVVATDVGSLREDVADGVTGMLCAPESAEELSRALGRFFDSDLFADMERTRDQIIRYGKQRYSWETVAKITVAVYRQLTDQRCDQPGK